MSEASIPATDLPPQHSPAPPRNNYGWIGFFAFIIVASVGVAWFMIEYNLRLQLKPEQLEEARELWKKSKLHNYNMVYTKRLNDDAKVDKFEVEVRGGEVKKVLMNGKLLKKENDTDQDPRPYHSMDGLFRDIERFMDLDRTPGASKVYVTAIFDDQNGCVRRYIRRVMGTTLRIEMHVKLEAAD